MRELEFIKNISSIVKSECNKFKKSCIKIKNRFFDIDYFGNIKLKIKKNFLLKNISTIYNSGLNIEIKLNEKIYLKFILNFLKKNFTNFFFKKKNIDTIVVEFKKISSAEIKKLLSINLNNYLINIKKIFNKIKKKINFMNENKIINLDTKIKFLKILEIKKKFISLEFKGYI
ncbi:hypothetical protein [Candidatus Vidania fulgoroideorum]